MRQCTAGGEQNAAWGAAAAPLGAAGAVSGSPVREHKHTLPRCPQPAPRGAACLPAQACSPAQSVEHVVQLHRGVQQGGAVAPHIQLVQDQVLQRLVQVWQGGIEGWGVLWLPSSGLAAGVRGVAAPCWPPNPAEPAAAAPPAACARTRLADEHCALHPPTQQQHAHKAAALGLLRRAAGAGQGLQRLLGCRQDPHTGCELANPEPAGCLRRDRVPTTNAGTTGPTPLKLRSSSMRL